MIYGSFVTRVFTKAHKIPTAGIQLQIRVPRREIFFLTISLWDSTTQAGGKRVRRSMNTKAETGCTGDMSGGISGAISRLWQAVVTIIR